MTRFFGPQCILKNILLSWKYLFRLIWVTSISNVSNYMVVWMVMNPATLIFTKNNGKNPVQEVMISMFCLPNPIFMSLFLTCQKYVFWSQPTLPLVTMSLFLLFFFLKSSLSQIQRNIHTSDKYILSLI